MLQTDHAQPRMTCQENMPKKVTLRLRVLDEKNGTKGGGF